MAIVTIMLVLICTVVIVMACGISTESGVVIWTQ